MKDYKVIIVGKGEKRKKKPRKKDEKMKVLSLDDIVKGRDDEAIKLLNTLNIAEVKIEGDELICVYVLDDEWNRQILVNAGMPRELMDMYFAHDGSIEISEFAFMKGAEYFQGSEFH